jgi:hypothetical protein
MSAQPLPGSYTFELYRGDTRVWQHQLLEDGGVTPIDITGWEFLSQYRATTEEQAVMATETIELTDPTHGIFTRTLPASEAAKLLPGQVAWDLQATKTGDIVKTYLANATVKVRGDVSRA